MKYLPVHVFGVQTFYVVLWWDYSLPKDIWFCEYHPVQASGLALIFIFHCSVRKQNWKMPPRSTRLEEELMMSSQVKDTLDQQTTCTRNFYNNRAHTRGFVQMLMDFLKKRLDRILKEVCDLKPSLEHTYKDDEKKIKLCLWTCLLNLISFKMALSLDPHFAISQVKLTMWRTSLETTFVFCMIIGLPTLKVIFIPTHKFIIVLLGWLQMYIFY